MYFNHTIKSSAILRNPHPDKSHVKNSIYNIKHSFEKLHRVVLSVEGLSEKWINFPAPL